MACKQQTTRYSPYSKMYLVSPGIYEKMLKCIDEGDKAATEALNTSSFLTDRKRPAEQAIDDMYKEELQRAPLSTDQLQQPDVQHENLNVPIQDTPIIPNYGSNIVPLNVAQQRPLAEDFSASKMSDVSAVPMPGSSFHAKLPINRRISELFSEVESSIPLSPVKTAPKRFPCSFCDKTFSRKHDVKRHINEKHGDKGELENVIAESSAAYDAWKDNPAESSGEESKLSILDKTPTKKSGITKVKKTISVPTKIHKTRSTRQQTASGMFKSWK